ncbi:hypothetical protein NF212_11155 [Parasalinivibrio latis]|uniref:hypothetical protein n=1 Tax=Parasalinivibrio latis TaxID=2952610 RepID=UPI0030E1F372
MPFKKLISFVSVINLLAALLVFVLSQLISFFRITHFSDFLFYMVIVIWGIAGLTWIGGAENKNWDKDDAAYKTRTMVSGHDFDTEKHTIQKQNYKFGFIMFIAGLPATILLTCIQILEL